ncbi:aldolase [Bacillus sp. EB600]|uniref:aldolase n=1 Tax=Bacillus sp. EB600 TaxID=2806345 RepID=UPI00210C72D3|nr:aldolase [Bacillus sp. EB600]
MGIAEGTIYKAFGLVILSEIPLPELVESEENGEQVDISINIDNNLSHMWNKSEYEPGKFAVEENSVMFQIPNTATFCIKDGKSIIVLPMKGSEAAKIRLYILGTCIGVLLMQRRILPLHGSAVAIDGKAYAFIGESGAGKSTLASAFISKGYRLLSDDVIAIDFKDGSNVPSVMPSYPQQKLWQESLREFGMETKNYHPLFERETKYSIPVKSNFFPNPLPLAGVFELSKSENPSISLCKIEGLVRFRTILNQTFRSSLINRLGLSEWHFKASSKFINKIDIYQLQRPTSRFTADDLVSTILKSIAMEESKC